MKIVDIKTTPILGTTTPMGDRGTMIVEVETDEGLTGIGEADAVGNMGEAYIGVKAYIERAYKKVLLGEDPTNYRYLWEKMINCNMRWWTDVGIGMNALSGVDTALVDLAGKALGVPAYKILGGGHRTKVRPYASYAKINIDTPEKTYKYCAELVERGFTAFKISSSWMGPGILFGDKMEKHMGYLKKIRDTVGYDVDIMMSDRMPRRSVGKAISIAKELEKFDLTFWEDPLRLGDVEGYAKLSGAVGVPIEVGEEMTNKMLKYMILRNVVDAINPDVCQIGGLSEMKKIADLAYHQGIKTYPHQVGSAIATAANIHLVASMPDGDLFEYRTNPPTKAMDNLLVEPFKFKNGLIEVPQGPGLGIELDPKVVKEITWNG